MDRVERGSIVRRNVIVTSEDEAHGRVRRMPRLSGDPQNLIMLNTLTMIKGTEGQIFEPISMHAVGANPALILGRFTNEHGS